MTTKQQPALRLTLAIFIALLLLSSLACLCLVIHGQITRRVRVRVIAVFDLGLPLDRGLDGSSTAVLNGVVHLERQYLSSRCNLGVGGMGRDRSEEHVQSQEVRDSLDKRAKRQRQALRSR